MRTQNLRPHIFSPYVFFKKAELLDCRMNNNELALLAIFALFVSSISSFLFEKMTIILENLPLGALNQDLGFVRGLFLT